MLDALTVLTNHLHPAWHLDDACRQHPEIDFIPTRGQSPREAKAICARWLVSDECRAAGLARSEFGLYG